MTASARAVAARAASMLLRYPDAELLRELPAVHAALVELPHAIADPLLRVAGHRLAANPTELASEYVRLFDLQRRCCLHLTYYSHGDTRRRGAALVAFAAAYRHAGLVVTGGELPDYLPAVLELAAVHESGWRLLREHRVGLDLLARSLAEHGSVYQHAVQAVRDLLPAPSRADLVAAEGLARSGPPREEVGLEPYPVLGGRG